MPSQTTKWKEINPRSPGLVLESQMHYQFIGHTSFFTSLGSTSPNASELNKTTDFPYDLKT